MPMTLEQIRNQLGAIEPDSNTYAGIDSAEIPLLEKLVQDKEAWMASRAVFALSRISDSKAVNVLARAATDSRQEVRVAVASSAANLKPSDANQLLVILLGDPELGVRKFAVQSVSKAHNNAVHAKVLDIQTRDPAPAIRDVAKFKLQELRIP